MKSERLLSLDILRGITIVGMILVNNPGTWESIYAPLRHAEWNGLTPTDLVFPFFMFIMGVSMSFALSRFDHHFSRGFIIKLVRRTVILFLLGLFLSWFSLVCTGVEQPFSHIRILGVLQRLALAYFFGSLLIVGVRRPANLAWISGIILAGYSILLALGHGFELSEQNIIAVTDRTLFGEAHLYREWLPDGGRIFFDPEGLLSTLPCIAQVIIGYFCGNILREKTEHTGHYINKQWIRTKNMERISPFLLFTNINQPGEKHKQQGSKTTSHQHKSRTPRLGGVACRRRFTLPFGAFFPMLIWPL